MNKGILHLLPNILAYQKSDTLPASVGTVIHSIKHFFVEEIKSTRRLLRLLDRTFDIDACTFYTINEHSHLAIADAEKLLHQGISIAFIAEAGCPGVADPGQELAAMAHRIGAIVKPYVGPNSLLLALMASGFNGQHFQFWGYLPNKQPMLAQKIKLLEQDSVSRQCSQLFIETPYRNHQLLSELIQHAHPNTRLCIAANLTADDEWIRSMRLSEWKKMDVNLHKIPAVFVLYAGD